MLKRAVLIGLAAGLVATMLPNPASAERHWDRGHGYDRGYDRRHDYDRGRYRHDGYRPGYYRPPPPVYYAPPPRPYYPPPGVYIPFR